MTSSPAIRALRASGQSLWLDNITRQILNDGTLQRYIDDLAVTGLTSNPTIFDLAIKSSSDYDATIRRLSAAGMASEALFFDLALEDLTRAADLFRPVFDATGGRDGWVSLEVSPLLVNDAAGTIQAARQLHERAARPNLFIKIPGTLAGLVAIEEAIFAGVPVNVTLLFSVAQCVAANAAYVRGIERRLAQGLDAQVASVASLFISRWDRAVVDTVPAALHNRLGLAVAGRTLHAWQELHAAARWQKVAAAGAHSQRLLWASTGTKDPGVADTFYVDALAAPDTVNTIPEKTLLAVADHGRVGSVMAADGVAAAAAMAQLAGAGVDETVLAAQLQLEGVASFEASWHELMARIAAKRAVVGGP